MALFTGVTGATVSRREREHSTMLTVASFPAISLVTIQMAKGKRLFRMEVATMESSKMGCSTARANIASLICKLNMKARGTRMK